MEKVEFNYFYKLFIVTVHNKLDEIQKMQMLRYLSIMSCYNANNLANVNHISKEDELKVYEEALMEICIKYMRLDNIEVEIDSNNIFDLVRCLIKFQDNGINKENFLISMQFILCSFASLLDIGDPILFASSDEADDKVLEVRLNDDYKIMDIEGINLSEEEMTLNILDLIVMTKDKKQGPFNQTRMRKLGTEVD